MIEMTYQQLKSPALHMTLNKLASLSLPVKISYRIMKMKQKIDREVETARTLWRQLGEKYGEFDEKGGLVHDQTTQMPKAKNPDDQEAYHRELQEFDRISFKLEYERIPVESLEGTRLTANELIALEPLLVPDEAKQASA